VRSGWIRLIVLVLVVAATAVAVLWRRDTKGQPAPRLAYTATAHQHGVVGYRDPVGAISADGAWIAYSEGRFLRVRSAGGGSVVEFPPATGQIRYLAWMSDGKGVLVEDAAARRRWWIYDLTTRDRRALWEDVTTIKGQLDTGEWRSVTVDDLRQIAWAPDGHAAAAIMNADEGNELWVIARDWQGSKVRRAKAAIAFPAWSARGAVACVMSNRLSLPCGEATVNVQPALDVYGPPALSPDGAHAYVGAASPAGTLDLWDIDVSGRRATRLTNFTRDTYQPSVTSDGAVAFKVQSYRTHVADVEAAGGAVRVLATFQSETPSWDPAGRALAVTFGTWRRVTDDAKYPDIAQDIGIINLDGALPADRPASVIAQSPSEDQSMAWSPNRRWIALHSHREMSDDVWLRPADASAPDQRISFLGRGAETGWPRWSPDGRWVLFTATRRADGRAVPYVIGVDPQSGVVTAPAAELAVAGFDGGITHAEWLPDGERIVAVGSKAPGRQAIIVASRRGGAARVVHEFASEHGFPGLGVSPDGRQVAFVAPAADGFFQIFRLPIDGGATTQVTTDPSNKSQPAWSPDGARIAFTAWSYDAEFWIIR
jgi:Tol biopolymer transport system component